VTAHATEAAARFVEAGRDPAHEHAPVAPAADVADEPTDEAVQVRDGVRTAERTVERARDAEPLQGQRLVEPYAAWPSVMTDLSDSHMEETFHRSPS
jgi:hypothetical protein